MYDPSKLTFEEVRLMSIQLPTSKSKEVVRNAQLWITNTYFGVDVSIA
jgi:hypothetical protein